MWRLVSYLIFILLLCVKHFTAVELTFELLDNAKDCFFEVIPLNTSVILEYQVSLRITIDI